MTHNLFYLKAQFTEGSKHCPCQLQNESVNVVWVRVTICSKMHAYIYVCVCVCVRMRACAVFAECRILNVVIVGA
jgi:hypothetical protein